MAKVTQKTEVERTKQLQVVGEVISDKMNKTITVKIYRRVRHPKYGKYQKMTSVFKAHDEKNQAKKGDTVLIQMTRPLSKTKRWRLIQVMERGEAELEGVQV